MSGATIFVVGMLVLLAAYGLAMWLIFAKDRDIFRPTREPSEFELAAMRLSEAFKDMQRQFALALTPALLDCTRAMTRFHEALTRDEHNTGIKP